MKKIFSIIAVAAAFCSAMVSCTCSSDKDVKAEHVFLIGLDGWGSYSVEDADMPNVKALMSDMWAPTCYGAPTATAGGAKVRSSFTWTATRNFPPSAEPVRKIISAALSALPGKGNGNIWNTPPLMQVCLR